MAALNPKIAALIPYPVYPAKMGGQKGVVFFYRSLVKQMPVALLGIKGQTPDAETAPFFHGILSHSRTRYFNLMLFFTLKDFLRNNNIHTLIIEHPYYGWMAWMLKKFAGIQVVVHSHNIESERFRSTGKWWWRIMRLYEGWVHRMADFSFFITAEDRDWAKVHYAVNPEKCAVVPYGSDIPSIPDMEQKQAARKKLDQLYSLSGKEKLFFFNGTLNYGPNLAALHFILQQLNPVLKGREGEYRIIICGKGLPQEMNELKAYRNESVIYAGFVDDIEPYFLGSDIFLNPVVDGGGIKTKLVEAIAANLTAVSSRNGAIGVPAAVAGNKLLIVENETPEAYLHAISKASPVAQTSATFFEFFYWGNIAQKAAGLLSKFVIN